MAVDKQMAHQWAQQDELPWKKFLFGLIGFWWYQVRPRFSGPKFTILRFGAGMIRILAVIGIATSPFWILYYTTQTINFYITFGLIVALTVFMLYIWGYDKFSNLSKESENRRIHERSVALIHLNVLKKMESFFKIKLDASAANEIDHIIGALLNCIDQKTRAFLATHGDVNIEASLLLFIDREGHELLIAARAHPMRETQKIVECSEAAAYYVAKAKRDWKAIHDLKAGDIFPYSGLARSDKPDYRSFLLIPFICDLANGSGEICKGVVSVDSRKPYEFWGAIGSDLTTQLMPYIQLINLLVNENKYGMNV